MPAAALAGGAGVGSLGAGNVGGAVPTSAAQPIIVQVAPQAVNLDGVKVAQLIWPEIRTQSLRTTARHTQNIYGGSAGRLISTP